MTVVVVSDVKIYALLGANSIVFTRYVWSFSVPHSVRSSTLHSISLITTQLT
jgi:hypothetical protein